MVGLPRFINRGKKIGFPFVMDTGKQVRWSGSIYRDEFGDGFPTFGHNQR